MALPKTEEVVSRLRESGLKVAAISVVSALGFGVVDQFAGKIIPSAADAIQEWYAPPKFFITFSPPVDLSAGFTLARLDTGSESAVGIAESKPGTRVYTASNGPGTYRLQLRGGRDKPGQELVEVKRIDKSGDTWKVDTGERNWANAAELQAGPRAAAAQPPSANTPVADPAASSRLSNTRWTVTEQDAVLLASAEAGPLRSMLANALAEVGVFEKGSDAERRRIVAYWSAAGPGWSQITADNLTTPWGGAFLAWIVRQAGAQPPQSPASFLSWQNWDEAVSADRIAPGMVALFRLDVRTELPQAISRRLAGIVVRRQKDCIEIVAGNVVDRVVVTCVAANLLETAKRPRAP